ncbi:Fe-S oxidoreductase [bacterium BRH_c32]|nr:MAG: Fe-S oxidoreductase [bacterium BRH_c32]
MLIKSIILTLVLFGAFLFLGRNIFKIIKNIRKGRDTNRLDKIPLRIKAVLKIAFAQTKLLTDPIPGLIHFFIFWGFVLFIFAVIESILMGYFEGFSLSFTGILFSAITLVQDFLGIVVLIAVIFAFYRRYIEKVPRLQGNPKGNIDAGIILLLIAFVIITMFGQNISHIAKNNFVLASNEFRPISFYLSKLIYGTDIGYSGTAFEIFWWSHIVLILGFMNYLPYSKHFHVFSSIPNVFFGKTDVKEKYALTAINFEEDEPLFGASDVTELTWKQNLDGYSCTECGRCTAACPANNTGKLLSPKKIITDIRKRLVDQIQDNILLNNYITAEELWACTTCNACVYECPVMIEHVDTIVDLRRNLVLAESQFPSELNDVFKNLEVNQNPWGFDQNERTAWAEGLEIKTYAEDPNCDLLFWVGCSGAFDTRNKKVTKAFASIMKSANIDFRILGSEEKCNGDTARRLGNEYLAQSMITDNVNTLRQYNVKKIVTTCPHCFNSISNEYPKFGADYEVVHHTQFLNELVSEGKIKLKENSIDKVVTFHDSCYLGRYNSIYNEPRDLIKAVTEKDKFIELNRNREKGFCCGAGGGRMFMEENEGERININRSKEIVDSGAGIVSLSCPFCMTMVNDGLSALNKSDVVEVKDLAEIIFENLAVN